jgi:uncharacterized membrane protein YjdF
MENFVRRFQLPILGAFFLAGSLFLFRMAYLPIWTSTPIAVLLIGGFWYFILLRYGIRVPAILAGFMLLAVEIDAIGNLFGWYNQRYSLIQYDEFSHCVISALVLPVIVWGMKVGLDRFGYRLPIGLIAFFSFATVFVFAGFYEVIELWDDKYMHPAPGWRIHGAYDTPNDLQWDIIGMGIGAIIGYIALNRQQRKKPAAR